MYACVFIWVLCESQSHSSSMAGLVRSRLSRRGALSAIGREVCISLNANCKTDVLCKPAHGGCVTICLAVLLNITLDSIHLNACTCLLCLPAPWPPCGSPQTGGRRSKGCKPHRPGLFVVICLGREFAEAASIANRCTS